MAEALARHAAGADLLVVQAGDLAGFGTAGLVLSDLVMQAGRPVLVLPADLPPVSLERVLVAGKTRARPDARLRTHCRCCARPAMSR